MAINLNQKKGESVSQWFNRLAHTADQRLISLESYQHDKFFRPATQWAYATAKKDIEKWDKGSSAHPRFRRNIPENEEKLRAKIADVQKFLEAPSSTKSGILKTYKEKADTLNQKYGTKFKWNQLAQYFESDSSKELAKKYGSKTALKVVAVVQKNQKKVLASIKTGNEIHLKADTEFLQDIIDQALKDIDIKDLF